MVDINILRWIFEDPHHIDWSMGRYLALVERLVVRILQYNSFPKTGSFNQIYPIVRRATYAIFGGMQVNWARVIMARYMAAAGLQRSTMIYCHY